jgi:zinc transporter
MTVTMPLLEQHTAYALTLQERGGLVWGHRFPDGEAVELDQSEQAGCDSAWLHLNLADGRARSWLQAHARLPAQAIALLVEPHPRVGCIPTEGGLSAVFVDLHHDFDGDPESFGEIRFYLDEKRIISARRRPLKSADVVHRAMAQGEAVGSPGAWLDAFLRALSRSFADAVRDLLEQVDALEDDVVSGKSTQEQRAQLGHLRRLCVRFRRHVHGDRQAVQRIVAMAFPQSDKGSQRTSLETLEGVAQDLDLLHERVRLLQEEVARALAEATNRNLYVLSVMTTALLPPTLVTGIWGMNVGGLPWADDPSGFHWAASAIVLSLVLPLLLLRGSRVL